MGLGCARMSKIFKKLFIAAGSLCLLALPSQATAQMQVARAKPQRDSYSITFKFDKKVDRTPVSFELIHNVLVFRADLNGEPVWAILDNAMDSSLIDRKFASDHKIMIGAPLSPLVTPTGSVERRRADDVRVKISGQVEFTAPFSVVDLEFLKLATGRPIAMVLGKEYFANLVFVILPSKKTFEVAPSGSMRLPPAIPFAALEDARPTLEIDVDGRKLKVLVDLGANSQLILNPEAWKGLKLDKAPQTRSWAANLNGKRSLALSAKVPSVTAGPFLMENVAASLQPAFPGVDGVLGLGFLSNFNFAIDVKARKLWMLGPVKKAMPPVAPAR